MVLSGIMFSTSSRIQESANRIALVYEDIIRRNVLESAANVAVSKVYQNLNWGTGFTDQSFSGANYSVSITTITADSAVEAKKVQVTAVATYAGQSDTTVAIYIQPAYSSLGFYSRKWPGHMTYQSGDTLAYRIHSDQKIRIAEAPVFLDKISSKKNAYTDAGNAAPKFYGSVEFGNGGIPEPNLAALRDSATVAGDVHNEELWLTFNVDGSYQCSTSTSLTTSMISDYNGTIMTSGADIHVKGTIAGKVTVISDNDIFIEGTLLYNTDPQVNPASPDYLGLIAPNDVIIADNAANANDVLVQAAIIARNKMKVENYNNGVPRGTLGLFGSVVQEDSDRFGLFSGGTLISGYETTRTFDERLCDRTPPLFPRMSRIEQIYRSD